MIETFRDVAFDKPDTAHPIMVDFPQGRMASPLWSEPMRVGAKLRFQVGIQEQADDLLN